MRACKDVTYGICCLDVMALHAATDHTEDSANTHTHTHAESIQNNPSCTPQSFNT